MVGKSAVTLDYQAWVQAHRYILLNYDHIEPFIDKHLEYLSTNCRNKREIDRLHHETFHDWFRLHVAELTMSSEQVSDEVQILAKGPLLFAKKYNSYAINGYNFHTKAYDEGRSVQSSGVAIVAETSCYIGNNESPMIRKKTYYGIITEIIELDYFRKGNIVLFKCDWVDNRVEDKWVKVDKFGIVNVNFKHLFNTGEKLADEPFILASQAIQVYYVMDPLEKDWFSVRQSRPRNCYDLAKDENEHLENNSELTSPYVNLSNNANFGVIEDGSHFRKDLGGSIVDLSEKGKRKNAKRRRK